MYTTILLFVLLPLINQIHGRTFYARQTDSLTIMREKCAQNPYAEDCTRIKSQMEDLLRKCRDMLTPVSACDDVKSKYCVIWPRELYCYTSSGGGGGQDNDPNWNIIPSDPNELKRRGDYCVSHQSEQKCRNLLDALKARYSQCASRPATDAACQSFKVSLCAAFPSFSPCLNGNIGRKRRRIQYENVLRKRREIQRN